MLEIIYLKTNRGLLQVLPEKKLLLPKVNIFATRDSRGRFFWLIFQALCGGIFFLIFNFRQENSE